MTKRLPSIPTVALKLTESDIYNILDPVKRIIDIRNGEFDPLERWVTMQDLVDFGLQTVDAVSSPVTIISPTVSYNFSLSGEVLGGPILMGTGDPVIMPTTVNVPLINILYGGAADQVYDDDLMGVYGKIAPSNNTTTFMSQGTSGMGASATNHTSQYPTSKKYEYIWAGRLQWDGSGAEQQLISKWNPTGTNQSFMWRLDGGSGLLSIYHIVTHPFQCHATVGCGTRFSNGELGWVKMTVDVVANQTFFYTSYDGISWSQLGGVGSISSGMARYPQIKGAGLYIGSNETYPDEVADETHYAAIQYTDLSTIHATFDPSGHAGESSFLSPEGDTWNMNGGATLVDV